MQCSEQRLLDHNNEVDSAEEVRDIIQEYDRDWQSTCGITSNPIAPLLGLNGNPCLASSPYQTIHTVTCNRPPQSQYKRICFCHTRNKWPSSLKMFHSSYWKNATRFPFEKCFSWFSKKAENFARKTVKGAKQTPPPNLSFRDNETLIIILPWKSNT